MVIIDFKKKGNMVRFFLGEKTPDWGWTNKDYKDKGKTPDRLEPEDHYYGDDWDDTPYEHNAGQVYDYFIKGIKDISFGFDDVVLEPCDHEINSFYSKEDMVNRKIPCIIVITKEQLEALGRYEWAINFKEALELPEAKKYYFGDIIYE